MLVHQTTESAETTTAGVVESAEATTEGAEKDAEPTSAEPRESKNVKHKLFTFMSILILNYL